MKRSSEEKSSRIVEQHARGTYKDVYAGWFQLQHALSQLLADADYDAVIDGSLQVLANLDRFRIMVLDAYASASAMKGRFDKAMRAAEEMIVRTPAKATGYMRAGSTLALQGKHKQAIQIYDRGIEKVPVEDKQHTVLKNRKAISQAQLNKRVDFLISLPARIASSIIDQLDITDRDLECMSVSKKWHQLLTEHSPAWKDIMLRDSSDTIFRILPVIGKHTRTLGSIGLDKEKSQQFSKTILSGHFCNIRYLHMHRCDVDRQQLLLILSRLGNTLTKLMLDVRKSSQGLPIETILLACPKLEVFRYFIGEGDMEFGDTSAPANVCKIKSLLLAANSVQTKVLDAMLRRCPQLQELFVKLCPVDALKLIADHCPTNLNSLGFNGIRPDLVSSPVDNFSGLRQVAIHQTAGMDPEHFIRILEKSPPALEALAFSINDEDINITERWDRMAKIKFENLRHISYCFANSMDIHMVFAKMIRNSRALQSVSLWSLENLTGTEFEEALLTLPDLAVLKLLVFKKVNVVGLKHFLTAHAGKGKASSLREVYINQCDDFPDSLLEMLATVETIEEIAMYSCKGPTTDGLLRFFKQICATNTLDNLHLSDMDSVDDTVLNCIRNIRSLRHIGLVRLNNITVDGVQRLAVGMKDLKDLNVLGCSQISMPAFYQVMEKLNVRNKARAIE